MAGSGKVAGTGAKPRRSLGSVQEVPTELLPVCLPAESFMITDTVQSYTYET